MARTLLNFVAMRPISFSAVLAAVALLGLPADAEAQGNPLSLQITELVGTGESCTTSLCFNRGLGQAACSAPESSSVRIAPASGTSITQSFVDLWVTTSSNDCSTTAARAPDTATCTNIGTADVGANSSFTVPLSQILTAAANACSDSAPSAGTPVRLYALTTGAEGETGDVGSNYGFVSVLVDPKGPGTVSVDQTSLMGDNQVTISWTAIAESMVRYRLYRGGACGSSTGDGATGERTLIKEVDIGSTSTTINPESMGLAVGESVSVYVVAVDQAGNEGVWSSAVCLTRSEVFGFCDVYSSEGGECDPDGCSAGGSPVRHAPLFSILLFGLVLGIRRRRS